MIHQSQAHQFATIAKTLLNDLIGDLSENAIRHIKMAMIIIFVYRATPSVGASLQWWQIDVLGFDESFFAKLYKALVHNP
jgi:hypothetical protein